MEQETQTKKTTERGRVPNWMVNALLSAISAVSLWLVKDYNHQVYKLEKEKAELQVKLDMCLDHRFDEMTHRSDEVKQELRELKQENKERFDSLTRNQIMITKKIRR